jgi:hypothetical protein
MFGEIGNTFSTIRAYRYKQRRTGDALEGNYEMSLRAEFIHLAELQDSKSVNFAAVLGSVRKTGYKWLKRFQEEGESGLANRSRRPHHSHNAARPGSKQP